MELSSSDEEDCQLPFWNNWLPPSTQPLKYTASVESEKVSSRFVCTPSFSATTFAKTSNCGNWIPPLNYFNYTAKKKTKKEEKNMFDKSLQTSIGSNLTEKYLTPTDFVDSKKKSISTWGERIELHNITRFNDGDLIWGVVNVGVFVHIKLWINEYGNICGSADGKISKLGCSETTFISIINLDILRRMLSLSCDQWASLCETVKETNSHLIFDAFQDFKLASTCAVEKLWFFICKRRHFLPNQCMLVKLSGAVKCMRNFKIIPKVVVQDIISTSEQPVS